MNPESAPAEPRSLSAADQVESSGVDPVLALALLANQGPLSEVLAAGIAGWEKYADQVGVGEVRARFLAREIHAFVDYLSLYFRTGDSTYKNLYIGEKIKQLYHGGETQPEALARARTLLDFDEKAFLEGMAGRVAGGSLERLKTTLDEIRAILLSEPTTTLDVLLIGDCLYLDIQGFLRVACLQHGIGLNCTYAVVKNGVILRNELKELASRPFDLIFYSPFSYEFSPTLSQLNRYQQSLASRERIRGIVDEVMTDVEATLNLLASRFECPIVVHNTVNVRRHDSSFRELAKNFLTRRARVQARNLINPKLLAALEQRNAMTFEHLFLLDETPLLKGRSENELGRMFYNSEIQHPAVLGVLLAENYSRLLAASVGLMGRKVVVCDLDNTLWAGEIGEGKVTHYLDRQKILKSLMDKGIVLAINSKNDPANVHFEGGLLQQRDFVDSQINWDSKVTNMKRIRENLNLKYKDYVFIDDRGDQLELVGSSLPEIRVLDATADESWRLLEAWASLLPAQNEGDRTQLYHERKVREDFVSEIGEEDQGTLFANLEIKLTLRKAVRNDLQRVTELINRTNQFNLAGSRTNFGEISNWQADPDWTIVVAEASDKFGQMGLICSAVLHRTEAAIEIPIFVLSCRVFGYGIETTLLNAVKRLARNEVGETPLAIRGVYKETSHNAPCKAMYPDNGFTWEGAVWIYQGDDSVINPSWLEVNDSISPSAGKPVDQR